MVPLSRERDLTQLALRLRSAAVFVPVTIAAVYFGNPWFFLLVAGSAFAMTWEWSRICANGRFEVPAWASCAGVAAAMALAAAGAPLYCPPTVVATAVVAWALARRSGYPDPAMFAVGAILVGGFAGAMIWLRADSLHGRLLIMWLIFAAWATDTGGYVVGKTVGGPKLAPHVSPHKTWSGLLGGIVFCAAWSLVWLSGVGDHDETLVVLVAICTAILAQAGDLSVSVAKRRFGLKDSSTLIPGHGGVLDRLDGMLLTGPALACFVALADKGWIEW